MFECSVTVDEEDHVIRHKPLAGETREKPSAANALGTVEELNANLGSPDMDVSSTVPDIIQRVAAPSQTLILEGRAVRIGCEIDPPVLVRLGGANFVQAGKRVKPGMLSTSINGQAVHYTLWRIEYLLDRPIGRIPLPANPFIGQDGADYR